MIKILIDIQTNIQGVEMDSKDKKNQILIKEKEIKTKIEIEIEIEDIAI